MPDQLQSLLHPLDPHGDFRLHPFIDSAPIAMLVVDQQGHIVFANHRAMLLFGYTADELRAGGLELLIPPAARPGHLCLVTDYVRSPVPRVMGVGREVNAVDRSGREFPVEIGLNPVDLDQRYVIAAVVDITERKRLERECTTARVVQQAMLPQSNPSDSHYEVAGSSTPASIAGGDFFDYIPLAKGRCGLVIGDASGHGLGSALVAASARSYFRALARANESPSAIMQLTNQLLIEDMADGRFVTLFYGILDPHAPELSFCGAGHRGYLLGANGRVKQQLESTGPPLGWFGDAQYTTERVPLERGDLVLLLTDGIEEGMSAIGEFFGTDRLLQAVQDDPQAPCQIIIERVLSAQRTFCGGDGADDVTVVCCRVLQ